ncbi:MAG: hypothetical protein ACP5GY_09540 [Vulcanisaeta sp.]
MRFFRVVAKKIVIRLNHFNKYVLRDVSLTGQNVLEMYRLLAIAFNFKR